MNIEKELSRIISSVGLRTSHEEVDHHIIGTFRARASEEARRPITKTEAFHMTDRRNPHLPNWHTIEYFQKRVDHFLEQGILRQVELPTEEGIIFNSSPLPRKA